MKKLLLAILFLGSIAISHAQNTLNINSNSLELISGGKSVWKFTGVAYVRKLNGISYTIGNAVLADNISYANIGLVSVGGATAVAPYSYDSLYNLIAANVINAAGGGGGGGDASAANQVTGNNILTAIDAGIPSSLGQKAMSGSMPVTIASDQQAIGTVGGTDISKNGTITGSGQTVAMTITGVSSAYVTIGGTFSGTVQFQGLQPDNATWVPLAAVSGGITNAYTTTATSSTGGYRIAIPASFEALRVNCISYTSGTINVYMNASNGSAVTEAIQLNPANFNATVTINNQTPTIIPPNSVQKIPVTQVPQKSDFRVSFHKVLNNADPTYLTTVATGAGINISQTAGTLVINANTTVNAETILRSTQSFQGPFALKYSAVLSQRIANNNFYVEMVDLVGDNLSITVNSSTSVTVTIPGTTLDATSVGQSIYIGALAGFTGVTAIPGRYAIASVSGNAVTFTVAGWATGAGNTGTCSLFGYNYHQIVYNGVTATNAGYQTQRNGWANTLATATINTTASPGHLGIATMENGVAAYADQLLATTTSNPQAMRGSFVQLFPDPNITLYLQIRCVNGSTAPASNTAFTMSVLSVENYTSQPTFITSTSQQSFNSPLPVQFAPNVGTTPAFNVSQYGGTAVVNGGVAGMPAVAGNIAHSAASTANPLQVGGRVMPATPDLTLTAGDVAYDGMTTQNQKLVKQFAPADYDYTFLGSIVNTTTPAVFKAAAGASIRNMVTGVVINNDALSSATEIVIRDGAVTMAAQTPTTNILTASATEDFKIGDQIVFSASTFTGITVGVPYYVLTTPSTTTYTLSATPNGSTLTVTGTNVTGTANRILFRTKVQPTASAVPTVIQFATPLRGNPNSTLDIQSVTATPGNIYYNIQGYIGF